MHRSRAYVATLLVLVFALACAAPAAGVTASDLTKHQQAADSARSKAAQQRALAKKLSKETARLDAIVGDLQEEADALDPDIAEATKRANRLEADVADLRKLISAKQSEIDRTQAEYVVEQGYFARRVEASYKKQDRWFYLDLLLSSHNVGDFIARTEFVDRAIRSSNTIAANLTATKEGLARARAELERSLEAVNIKRQEAAVVESKLRDLQEARQAKTDQQDSILRQKSSLLSESKHNAKRLAAIAAAEEAASARIAKLLNGNGSGSFKGTMTWPVPGFTRITSSFGWRMHPVLHVKKFHSGVDVGRNGGQSILGASIVAAGSGKVIWAGANGGYGNVVMIDHGNGVVSVYAHQKSGGIKVGVGQHVSRGQRIGTVGSSGLSTGPHLHFEVRVNGTPKNPLNYTRP